MTESRSLNTKRNIASGVVFKIITILLPFLIRTAILYLLGEQYVGLSSLFTSILQVLNLAELGFSNAIVYNMYKPIADGNERKVCALLALYKKAYCIFGTFIFVCGLVIMPFIPILIKGTWPNDINIYFLYFLYLLNTAVSYYVFAYKSALLNALQRIDIANIVISVTFVIKYIIQLAVLIVFKNFYLYVLVAIIATVANNIVTAYLANRRYPQYKAEGKLQKTEIREIKKQISGLMICKLSDTSRNSFDSIVLSLLFGLTIVAIYNNYYYIFSSIHGIVLVISQAMQASVGNSIATETKQKNHSDLRKFQFIFSWIVSWCSIAMLCLYQPFMKLWAGDDLLLSNVDMILFCVYFYTINMNNMRNLYFNGNGLWWAGNRSFVLESIFNLILNIGLGIILGTTGVLLATIFTIVVFNFITRTNILYREYFELSPKQFYIDHIKYMIVTAVCGVIVYAISNFIPFAGILGLLCIGIICGILPNFIFWLIYHKFEVYVDAKEFVTNLIKRKGKII